MDAAIIVLNGADTQREWTVDPAEAVPGAMPRQAMPRQAMPRQALPRLTRDDRCPLRTTATGWRILRYHTKGSGRSSASSAQRSALNPLRTRAGLTFIAEATAAGRKVTPGSSPSMLSTQRHVGAELLLDDVLTRCAAPLAPVPMQTASVDITPSCSALRGWNRTETTDGRGAQVWREFWRVRVPNLLRSRST
ncbi:penicillin acylase family protein [Gemmatimonas sp.]|uniref:penicillin acylase family protein n=1 Tax=Gemmatimonas sp. TaxID=1962908 RepID=UPI003983908F